MLRHSGLFLFLEYELKPAYIAQVTDWNNWGITFLFCYEVHGRVIEDPCKLPHRAIEGKDSIKLFGDRYRLDLAEAREYGWLVKPEYKPARTLGQFMKERQL